MSDTTKRPKRINLEAELLPELTEGMVLEFVVQEFKLNNKNVDAITSLAEAAKCSQTHFSNALAERTSIGIEGWAGVISRTKTNLFFAWSKAVWKKYELDV